MAATCYGTVRAAVKYYQGLSSSRLKAAVSAAPFCARASRGQPGTVTLKKTRPNRPRGVTGGFSLHQLSFAALIRRYGNENDICVRLLLSRSGN